MQRVFRPINRITIVTINRYITGQAFFPNLVKFAKMSSRAVSCDVQQSITSKHFGFIGSGKMAQAMVRGFLDSGIISGKQVTMADIIKPDDTQKHNVEYLQSNATMVDKSDVIIACVKPHILSSALGDIKDKLQDKLIISIAAGITMKQLKEAAHPTSRLVRVMPNTPCLVRCGTAVYTPSDNTSQHDIDLVTMLARSVFSVFEPVPERLFNAATAVSGCGPAFVYLIAEAMADGGVRMGLPRALAHKLAVDTLLGSARMMQETGLDPALLKNDVCSPGGATIAGVHALEEGRLRGTLINAIQASCQRGDELGQ